MLCKEMFFAYGGMFPYKNVNIFLLAYFFDFGDREVSILHNTKRQSGYTVFVIPIWEPKCLNLHGHHCIFTPNMFPLLPTEDMTQSLASIEGISKLDILAATFKVKACDLTPFPLPCLSQHQWAVHNSIPRLKSKWRNANNITQPPAMLETCCWIGPGAHTFHLPSWRLHWLCSHQVPHSPGEERCFPLLLPAIPTTCYSCLPSVLLQRNIWG